MTSNFAGALERLGNDVALFHEFIGFYEDDCPKLLENLRTAVHRGDARAVHLAAHALKGLVANLGGEDVVAAAASLEFLGRQGDLSDVEEGLALLEHELRVLNDEINVAKAVPSKPR